MYQKLSNCRREIAAQSQSFKAYIDAILSSGKLRSLMDELCCQSDVYVFGGVIRNFLLGYSFHRDIDFVVYAKEKITLPIGLLHGVDITRNKFGGVKLNFPHITIDIWNLQNTWGLQQISGNATPYTLIKTVFFNFSAIIFDYNRQRFIYSHDFLEFYATKMMDVIYGRNPYPTACVVNSFYYAQEYCFPIGKKLKNWIAKQVLGKDIESQQLRRYGEVKYSEEVIRAFANVCKIVKSSNTSVSIHDKSNRQYLIKFV